MGACGVEDLEEEELAVAAAAAAAAAGGTCVGATCFPLTTAAAGEGEELLTTPAQRSPCRTLAAAMEAADEEEAASPVDEAETAPVGHSRGERGGWRGAAVRWGVGRR